MIRLWGLLLTLGAYFFTLILNKKFKIFKDIPPIITTSIIVICVLKMFNLEYFHYNQSAYFITSVLGVATIALGYPLSKYVEIVAKNKEIISCGILVASLVTILAVYILGILLGANFGVIISMIPKSVTAPIAVEISKTIGGMPELTACIVVCTGILGGLSGHKILKMLHIKSDIAIGLSMGATSHILGTSRCLEKNKEKQAAASTVALIMSGILVAIIAPIFVYLIK